MLPAAPRSRSLARRALLAAEALVLLWLAFSAYAAGEPLWALGLLAIGGSAAAVYAQSRSVAWKYLFPGVAGMLLFVAVPLAYTVRIGFTNYSSNHLLTQAQVRAYLQEQVEVDEARAFDYRLHRLAGGLRMVLVPADGRQAPALTTAALALDEAAPPREPVPTTLDDGSAPGEPLGLREVIALRGALQRLRLRAPDGTVLGYAGLRQFAPVEPVWESAPGGALRQRASGAVFRPDAGTGYFQTDAGERVTPGFTSGVGFAHYARMLFDADVRAPFVSIFVWTVAFAALTVLFSAGLGLALAAALEWPALSHRGLYRTLLFLPYAVPGFISILVFKGLFNQNFGEINAILDALFGIRPAWFADPWLARGMLLVVNTWLGYPYFMVLCSGLLKAVPADLYEASAIAGAGPWTNFSRITAPLIARPLTPLLISAFAFNFNNFVLISLLTDGRPDHLNTKLPAGTTDILVSYTYRIAFTDAGQNFGLAAAISTLIFAMVAAMGIVQLRYTRAAERDASKRS